MRLIEAISSIRMRQIESAVPFVSGVFAHSALLAHRSAIVLMVTLTALSDLTLVHHAKFDVK